MATTFNVLTREMITHCDGVCQIDLSHDGMTLPRSLRPPAGRHDQRRQIGSLRKKKSPALVSGAEDDDRSLFLRNQAIPIRAIGSSKRLL
jgi:hypothetical protein